MAESSTPWVLVAFDLPLDTSFTYRLPLGTDLGQNFVGCRVRAPFRNREKEGLIVQENLPEPDQPEKIKTLVKLIDVESLFGPQTLAVAQWMAKQYFCSVGEALSAMVPSARRERELPGWESHEQASDHDLALSEEQESAIEALRSGTARYYYLQGITGSGKTEVFLQAARLTLDSGKSVLYLVPEIALTWQLRNILSARFHSRVAVLHSQLTPSQRLQQWRKIQSGGAMLVVGARSAVFAPVENLGLVIVDEEHESGYKSSSSPRYHARQVAFWLASRTGAKVVLGSATPSLEAVQQMRAGELQTLRLTKRLAGGAPPEVRVVNLRGCSQTITPDLMSEMQATLDRKRQIVLFHNRRGFSQSFHCRSCGHDILCKNCSVSMTWHKKRGVLLCHYCGSQQRPVQSCPECGSLDVGWSTVGTEHIEEELLRIFPNARIARLDSDIAEKKGQTEAILGAFGRQEVDILIGTQMVAKGLNFPGLQLVGILQADLGLGLPDFRASERVFGLIRQVSGRAGRFFPDGKVIVQTLRPEALAIQRAVLAQDEDFWSDELQMRQALGFPPYSRMIRIVVRGKNLSKVREDCHVLTVALHEVFSGTSGSGSTEILGPTECLLALVAGNFRWQILLRSQDFPRMHHGLSGVLRTHPAQQNTYREIDVDPLNML